MLHSSSINYPMFTATNYTVWAIHMKILLSIHEVWKIVEEESTEKKKNNMATALIFQSILETMILQVGHLDSAHKVWEAIKTRNVGADRVREARLQTLMTEFEWMKMREDDKIDDFAGKLSELASKAAAMGESIDESKLVKKLLGSFPRKKFIHIVASLEQLLDLNRELRGRHRAIESLRGTYKRRGRRHAREPEQAYVH